VGPGEKNFRHDRQRGGKGSGDSKMIRVKFGIMKIKIDR